MTLQSETKTIQPSELFKLLGVKNQDEALQVLSAAYSFLCYLKPGESLEVGGMTFDKMDSNLIYLTSEVDVGVTVEVLEKRRIVRIPV